MHGVIPCSPIRLHDMYRYYLHLFQHMEFGLDKCANTLLKKENVYSQSFILDMNRETRHLKQGKTTSKYLGNEESEV